MRQGCQKPEWARGRDQFPPPPIPFLKKINFKVSAKSSAVSSYISEFPRKLIFSIESNVNILIHGLCKICSIQISFYFFRRARVKVKYRGSLPLSTDLIWGSVYDELEFNLKSLNWGTRALDAIFSFCDNLLRNFEISAMSASLIVLFIFELVASWKFHKIASFSKYWNLLKTFPKFPNLQLFGTSINDSFFSYPQYTRITIYMQLKFPFPYFIPIFTSCSYLWKKLHQFTPIKLFDEGRS